MFLEASLQRSQSAVFPGPDIMLWSSVEQNRHNKTKLVLPEVSRMCILPSELHGWCKFMYRWNVQFEGSNASDLVERFLFGAEFHVGCIDQWLLTRRPFCPVCKRDANTDFSDPAATETTPLLVAAAGRALSVPVTSSATQTSPVGSPTNQTTQSLPSDSFAGSHNTHRGGDLV